MSRARLHAMLGAELARPAPAGAVALAAALARRGGSATALVLYYGSALRAGSLEGILDFYVLLDDVGAWPGPALARQANRWLPPNVGYLELDHGGEKLRAKYAVMSVSQFRHRLGAAALDTTLWARFCQPALCIWARLPADQAEACDLVADAVIRAGLWAARLGPSAATAEEYWCALFAHTYAAELRVEQTARPQDIVAKDPARYEALLPLAWQAADLAFEQHGAKLSPAVIDAERQQATHQWARRARHGRRLNALRLMKAAFTFDGAMDYVAWKIERHRGVRIEVSDWQRRFPLLAAPFLYWKLRRLGVLSRRDPPR
ncbi:MAG TPA: hypothetical protein VMK82_04830 [Steroidobacteraceae bacterium]|nr:hypothetical protein [Steroidobacteraceae bacterium]